MNRRTDELPALSAIRGAFQHGVPWSNFESLEEIGRGAMGMVYRAHDRSLLREVALKVISSEAIASPGAVGRLEREAHALAAISHPTVETLYATGYSEEKGPFLVLEFIDGVTLRDYLRDEAFELDAALHICHQIAQALNAAHAKGIVHRDLKPENVKVHLDRVKVLDFGLARWKPSAMELRNFQPAEPIATEAGTVLGTLHYMSPEQVNGETADHRADIWALGCVLFECLARRLAFPGGSPAQVIASILHDEPDWGALPDTVPSPVLETIRRCLERSKEHRLPTIGEAMRELGKALRGGVGRSDGPRPPLRLPVGSFVGRDAELAHLKARLRQSRLVTLTGIGGSGKTRLALQVAREVAEEFRDGAALVELGSLTSGEGIPALLVSALGLGEERGVPPLEHLLAYIESRSLLIILDNCEHLIQPCCEIVEEILARCPHVRVLATSREAFKSSGEGVFQVQSLQTPDPARLPPFEELAAMDSVRLFTERAQEVKRTFELSEVVAPAVAEICARLDGIPLAIELAAARMRMLSAEKIAARLSDAFRLLTGGRRNALERHRTLKATFDWSYDMLAEKEQRFFRLLAVFRGGWTLEATEEVCATEGIESGEVLDLLASLVDKSLVVVVDTESGDDRYRLLETVRDYADDLLSSEESRRIRDRHAEFFLAIAEESAEKFDGREHGLWSRRLDDDYSNLQAALEWTVEGAQGEIGLRLAGTLARFWAARGKVDSGRDWIERALASCPVAEDSPARRTALCGAGQLALHQGDFAAAEKYLIHALELARAGNAAECEARVLLNLGFLARAQRQRDRAQSFLEEALERARSIENRSLEAAALQYMGVVAAGERERFREAQDLLEASLRLYRALEDSRGVAAALNNLGNLATREGRFAEAGGLFEEGLALQEQLGHDHGIARTLASRAGLHLHQKLFDQARVDWERSLRLDRRLGARRFVASTLARLAYLDAITGEHMTADTRCAEASALARSVRSRGVEAAALHVQGVVAFLRGDDAAGRQCLLESLGVADAIHDPRGVAEAVEGLAWIAARSGKGECAARFLGFAAEARSRDGSRLDPFASGEHERSRKITAGVLAGEFEALEREGHEQSTEQVIGLARDCD